MKREKINTKPIETFDSLNYLNHPRASTNFSKRKNSGHLGAEIPTTLSNKKDRIKIFTASLEEIGLKYSEYSNKGIKFNVANSQQNFSSDKKNNQLNCLTKIAERSNETSLERNVPKINEFVRKDCCIRSRFSTKPLDSSPSFDNNKTKGNRRITIATQDTQAANNQVEVPRNGEKSITRLFIQKKKKFAFCLTIHEKMDKIKSFCDKHPKSFDYYSVTLNSMSDRIFKLETKSKSMGLLILKNLLNKDKSVCFDKIVLFATKK